MTPGHVRSSSLSFACAHFAPARLTSPRVMSRLSSLCPVYVSFVLFMLGRFVILIVFGPGNFCEEVMGTPTPPVCSFTAPLVYPLSAPLMPLYCPFENSHQLKKLSGKFYQFFSCRFYFLICQPVNHIKELCIKRFGSFYEFNYFGFNRRCRDIILLIDSFCLGRFYRRVVNAKKVIKEDDRCRVILALDTRREKKVPGQNSTCCNMLTLSSRTF